MLVYFFFFFFKQKTAYEIISVTGVQTCALPISIAKLAEQIEKDSEANNANLKEQIDQLNSSFEQLKTYLYSKHLGFREF